MTSTVTSSRLAGVRSLSLALRQTDLVYAQSTVPPVTAWHSLGGYSCLKLLGPDAVNHLHRRSSNTVESLAIGEGNINSVLDRKAHLLAPFSVHRLKDKTLYLLAETNRLPVIQEELKKFRFEEQYSVDNVSETTEIITLLGMTAAQALAPFVTEETLQGLNELPVNGIMGVKLPEQSLFLYAIQRPSIVLGENGLPGLCLVVAKADADKVKALLSEQALRELSSEEFSALQFEAGVLQYGSDYDETTLLPETGLESHCVDYEKGCFLGQETVARVKAYGAVQNVLMGVEVTELSASPEALIKATIQSAESKTVGHIMRAQETETGLRAFAALKKEARQPGIWQSVLINNQHAQIKADFLPFTTTEKFAQHEYDAGMAAFVAEDTTKAVQHLATAVQLAPNNGDYLESYGVVLGKSEQTKPAIVVMKALQAMEPERVMALSNLSVFYMQLGDKETAEEYKAQATSLSMKLAMRESMAKKQASAKAAASDTESQSASSIDNNKKKALEDRLALFEQAASMAPNDPLAQYGLGGAYAALERWTEAAEAFETTLQTKPNHSQCYAQLGHCYEQLKQFNEAHRVYTAGVQVAAQRGDRQPLSTMQDRLSVLTAS